MFVSGRISGESPLPLDADRLRNEPTDSTFRRGTLTSSAEGRTEPMKRAALYARVSTVDQHLETQLLDLRQMAKHRDHEIIREYTDTVSGTKSKCPGLDQLLADARRHRFDIVQRRRHVMSNPSVAEIRVLPPVANPNQSPILPNVYPALWAPLQGRNTAQRMATASSPTIVSVHHGAASAQTSW